MWIKALAFLVLSLTGAGCALVPPQKIPADRRNYIDAVSTSWKEQLLTNLVKLRYGDSLTFLELTGINTNYALETNVSVSYFTPWHFLWGTGGFRNSLTAGGGATYRDTPNITYSPIRGEALAKALNMPIPVTSILRSLQTGWRADYIFSSCIESINGLRNRSASGHLHGDPKFFVLAQRFRELSREGIIRITIDQLKETVEREITKVPKGDNKAPGKKKSGSSQAVTNNTTEPKLKIDKDMETTTRDKGDIIISTISVDMKRVREFNLKKPQEFELKKKYDNLIELLELEPNLDQYSVIDGNRQSIQRQPNGRQIVLQTRSIREVLGMFSNFIQVPDTHYQEQGRAYQGNLYEKKECLNCNLQNLDINDKINFIEPKDRLNFGIKSSIKKPDDSFVALKYHDHWFYVEDTDVQTKEIFSDTILFFSMAEPGTKEGTPVLTLPVQ